jgi:hypothetical protein
MIFALSKLGLEAISEWEVKQGRQATSHQVIRKKPTFDTTNIPDIYWKDELNYGLVIAILLYVYWIFYFMLNSLLLFYLTGRHGTEKVSRMKRRVRPDI